MKTVGCWLLNSKTTVERSTMTNRSLSFPLLLILLLLPVSHAKNDAETCEITAGPKNSAFVFVKPVALAHANTWATRELVLEKLTKAGVKIVSESDIDGNEIDEKSLIDNHYFSIASKATILPPSKIPVPADKFQEAFGESWDLVLKENRAYNAMEACRNFDCTPMELNDAWRKAERASKVVKFGGGFYCGLLSVGENPEIYVFNAFFMAMRSKFVGEGKSIHCYEVEWSQDDLSWADFRGKVLGPTDPTEAKQGSIRRTILQQYKKLGLESKPDKSDNGVHASASPFEGLAEKANWLGLGVKDDPFGNALLQAGIRKERLENWFKDPQIKISGSATGSLFDALEDLDAKESVKKLTEINKLN